MLLPSNSGKPFQPIVATERDADLCPQECGGLVTHFIPVDYNAEFDVRKAIFHQPILLWSHLTMEL